MRDVEIITGRESEIVTPVANVANVANVADVLV
jgi:hypothetical protein